MANAIEHTGSVVEEVRQIAGAILQRQGAALDLDEALGNVGFDSASLKALALRLSEHFRADVDVVALFTYPTLRSLAEYIAEQGVCVPAAGHTGSRIEARPAQADPRRDIAITGVSCRLPGAASKEEFWANQAAGRNCIREVPAERWDWKALFGDPLREAGCTDVRWGGFIQGEDRFSPEFFGISLYEAELMDPQHRLFLKAAWEAIWDAGHDPKSLAGQPVGVFAGVQFQDYQKLLGERGMLSAQACTGNAHAMIANRVSFLLDVNGPSETVDTACSSSLVAVHNAVRAIRNGECDLAIAGGVNLMLTPDLFIMGRQLGVLSPTGQCRTFDAAADGYVRAEGVGALLLKPLGDAIRDRDHIYGVIRGTAVNHGGRATSLTAPNSRAQAELMRRAMKDAGAGPGDISYVEMHGTGTELGDPIEVEGVRKAFRQARQEGSSGPSACALGSVKTGIGHLEPAAGVAGVINVLMAMANEALPGLSNFQRINPHLVLDDGFAVQTRGGPWRSPDGNGPLGAMVNSFGFGGANASVMIQEHRAAGRARSQAEVFVPLSASSEELLRAAAGGLLRALEHGGEPHAPADIAFTLQSRRDSRAVRAVLCATDLSDLTGALRAISAGEPLPATAALSGQLPAQAQEWPHHVRQWLATGETAWPDIPEAVRIPLPIPPWPDRSCWFEPRRTPEPALDEQASATVSYLEPVWQLASAGARKRLDHACVWVIGRSEMQNERFGAELKRRLPRKATLISSVVAARSLQAEPSLEVWNLAGDEPDMVIVLPADDASTPSGLSDTRLMFDLAKDLTERSFGRRVDVCFVASRPFGAAPELDALPALAKSAFLENPNLRIQTLYFDHPETADWIGRTCEEAASEPPDTPLALRFGASRSVLRLQEKQLSDAAAPSASWFRDGGVYLIPGGAGELGWRLLGTLAAEVDATFILSGRSAPEGAIARRIEELAGKARRPECIQYVACDIAEPAQAAALVGRIVGEHSRVDGVVNLVTAHDDAYLFTKSWEDFDRVCASKVRGTINLDRATADQPLDFFVAFSSLAALGMAGGSDYAYGCAFQNAFATWRDGEVAAGRRHGASHAISWSRWKWDKYVTRSFDDWFASMGFAFLDIGTGIEAWRAVMARSEGQTFAIYGRQDDVFEHLDLRTGLLRSREAPDATPTRVAASTATESPSIALAAGNARQSIPDPSPQQAEASGASTGLVHMSPASAAVEDALAAIIAQLLKLEAVDRTADFATLGLDSVMAIRLVMLIEQKLSRRLAPKDLLKHASVAKLAGHLLAQDGGSPAPPSSPPDELDEIASYLVSSLKTMLRADEVPADAGFGSLGVDSIIAVKLASEYNRRFGVGISPRWFIDFPTVDRFAREIGSRRTGRA